MDVMANYVDHLPPVPEAANPAPSTATKLSKQKVTSQKKELPKKKEKKAAFRIGIGSASIGFGGAVFGVVLVAWCGWVIYILHLSGAINLPW